MIIKDGYQCLICSTPLISNYTSSFLMDFKAMEKHDGETVIPTKVIVCQPVGGELCTSEETTESCWIEKNKVLEIN